MTHSAEIRFMLLFPGLPLRLVCGQILFKPQSSCLYETRPWPQQAARIRNDKAFVFFNHQCPLKLEDGRCSKPVLWCHLPPPAPPTECVRWTLLPVKLPANQGREFPALRVTFVPPLSAKSVAIISKVYKLWSLYQAVEHNQNWVLQIQLPII